MHLTANGREMCIARGTGSDSYCLANNRLSHCSAAQRRPMGECRDRYRVNMLDRHRRHVRVRDMTEMLPMLKQNGQCVAQILTEVLIEARKDDGLANQHLANSAFVMGIIDEGSIDESECRRR